MSRLKFFEHLLAKCRNNFAEKNKLFLNLQFGFCKGLDVCYALLIITNFVQKALDSGYKVHMVDLEFSSAFDHVYYEDLIYKLTVNS